MISSLVPRTSSNDLWAIAAAELSSEDRSNINFSCPDKLGILSDLLALTEMSRQECISKRWQYTRKSGERVILMDLFGKVVKWINLFKEVGDAAAQYDPAHAALPWAGVRFLLQIAVNDHDNFAFVVEGAASIAEIICRYAVFEELYLQSTSPATNELKRVLVQLYAAIMIYLSKAKSYFEQNSAKRIIRSGLLAKSDLLSYFSAITTTQESVDRCSTLVGMQDHIDRHKELRRLLELIDSPLKRLSEDFGTVKDNLETSKRTEILRWVSPEPYIQHHEQAKKEVLSGTGQWLLSDPMFSRWKRDSTSSILWLHGIPGSGKSKLVSIVIEDAMKAFHAGQGPPPAFFYCSRNTAEPTRSSPDAIIASIARQLSSLQPGLPLPPPMVATYEKREAGGFASGPLRMDESRALIIQLVEHYPLTTIVIDALDECDPERRDDLLETLETILQESSRLVKIFVSSRDDQDIVCHLRNYPNLELASDRNMDDITSFVRAETQNLIQRKKLLRSSVNKEELKDDIIDQVTKGAGGMFRWASLQLQGLCGATTDEAVRQRLGRLPPKLEDLYLELYENLTKNSEEADREVTMNAFSWLLCAQRRLASTEFLAALSKTPRRNSYGLTKDHVLELCSNMIVFDSTLDTFRFAHLSVREFLEKRPEYTSTTTNSLAAGRCLLELLNVNASPGTRKFLSEQEQPLWDTTFSHDLSSYSTIYWATHCQLAVDKRTNGVLRELFLFFLSGESDPASAFALWTSRLQKQLIYDIDWRLQRKLRNTTALLIACCFDFSEVIENLITGQTAQADFENRDRDSPLRVAVDHGSCKVILVLISHELTQITKEVVNTAAENEESGKEVMTLLLDRRGADIQITEEVIKAAAGNWGNGKEVMTLLLDRRGADVQITEEVVKAAAGNEGNGKEVMALLLDRRGADIQITEEVVKAAAGNGWNGKEVMTLLLDRRGADIQITEEVIKAAAGNRGNGKEVMALLLDRRGADIQITEEVVKAAAGNEESGEEILMLLLEWKGPNVVLTKDVVKAAATSGQEKVLKAIEKRFEVLVSPDDWLVAQFYNAAKAGHQDTIQKLLTQGVEPDLQNIRNVSPLWIAATNGHLRVVELLLGTKAVDVNAKSISGRPPLFWAAARGHEGVVRLLLEAGADPSPKDKDGETPLSMAKSYRNDKIANMLGGG